MQSNEKIYQQHIGDGVSISLPELIALRSYAKTMRQVAQRRVATHQSGLAQSHFRGRGMDFSEVRKYQAGDDIRLIDWRVTARTGKPHTKIFQEEREQPVILIIDLRANMFFGTRQQFKSVLAAKVAATVGWCAHQCRHLIGGVILHRQALSLSPLAIGDKGILPLLHQLVKCSQMSARDSGSSLPLNEALSKVPLLCKSGAKIFVISDFSDFTTPLQKQMMMLTQYHQLISILINDPLEVSLPTGIIAKITNINATEQALINSNCPAVVKKYQQQYQSFLQQFKDFHQRYAIPKLTLSTENAALSTLPAMFAKYEVAASAL